MDTRRNNIFVFWQSFNFYVLNICSEGNCAGSADLPTVKGTADLRLLCARASSPAPFVRGPAEVDDAERERRKQRRLRFMSAAEREAPLRDALAWLECSRVSLRPGLGRAQKNPNPRTLYTQCPNCPKTDHDDE